MSALSLVVILAAGEAKEPATLAMKSAAEETLGAGATVTLLTPEESPLPQGDADAIALEAARHADAIAAITWSDSDHRRVHVHLHVAATGRWIDRDIGFAPSDAPPEQGRTIGFTVASMLPERPKPDAIAPPPAPPSTPSLPIAPVTAPPPPALSPHAEAAPRSWSGSVNVAFQGASSIAGYGGGAGGMIALERYIGPHFALRIGAAARLSEVPVAEATSFTLTAGGGIAWRSITPTTTHRFAFGARIDALAIRQSLAHLANGDASSDRESRILPAADTVIEGSWLFTEGTSLVIGAGGEVAFGTTQVFTRRSEVAVLSPFHLLLEAGFRARF